MAARVRLRPILMTTAAMVTGLLPLLTASGAGAASRHAVHAVRAAGSLRFHRHGSPGRSGLGAVERDRGFRSGAGIAIAQTDLSLVIICRTG
jgi:hypothetical protein